MSRNYHSILNVLSPSFTNTYSLAFDGVDDYVTAPIPAEPYNTSAIRSFSVWVKIDTLNSYTPIFGDIGAVNLFRYANNFGLRTGRLRWALEGLNSVTACYIETELVDGTGTAPNIGDGNWHHLALYNAVDGDANRANIVNCKIYLDGVELTNTTENVGSAAIRGFIDGNLVMGAGSTGSFSGQIYLNGNLDEFAYFTNYELTQSDVTAIYNSGVPNDLNNLTTPPTAWYRNGDNGSYKSPQWLIPENSNKDKVSNYSFDFDGVDDSLIGPDANLASAYTKASWSYWFNASSLPSSTTSWVYSRRGSNDNYGELWGINNLGKLIGNIGQSNALDGDYIGSTTISTNTWYNVVITYDGSGSTNDDKVKVYLNGNLETLSWTGTVQTELLQNLGAGRKHSIGFGGASYFEGKIDEVAVWYDTTLTSANAITIYNSGEPADLSSLSPNFINIRMGENATFSTNWNVPDTVNSPTNDFISANMTIEDRVGEASNSSNNAVSFNMTESDRETDVPS